MEDILLEGTLLDISLAMVSRPWPGQDPAMVMVMGGAAVSGQAEVVEKLF